MNPDQSSRSAPLVSVAIPVYNGQDQVADSVRSVLAQTHPAVEVIVVDDGSTDKTWDVLKSLGPAVRTIRQRNGGLAVARNTGLQAARGEFIALMDHDDLCEPERLAVQVQFMQQHPELVLCATDFSAFNANGPVSPSHTGTYYSRCRPEVGGIAARFPQHGHLEITACLGADPAAPAVVNTHLGNVYDELALGNFLHPPTLLFRRSVLTDVGLFDPAARSMCDWEWLVKVARSGPVGFIDRPLLKYRLSATQLSSSPRAMADSLHVAQRICASDPALVGRHRAAFRHLLGEMHIDAAEVSLAHSRGEALSLLATGALRYGQLGGRSLRMLAKLATPAALLSALRRARAPARRAG
jgi:glycosyltransferase involved in cell wall biosynthesis